MFDYIRLLPGFVREVLDAYEGWNEKDGVPLKIQELMMVSGKKNPASGDDVELKLTILAKSWSRGLFE